MPQSNFYTDILYPLQDQFLKKLSLQQPPFFYLTGGTALNRCYCHTRFSDDLDFFSLNEIQDFRRIIHQTIELAKPDGTDVSIETISDHFCRIFLRQEGVSLKIDFINDTVFHFGQPQPFPVYPLCDNITNILTNKLTAISRHEVKDIVDLWTIAKTIPFSWREVMDIAVKKSPVDPIDISQTINSMPKNELLIIKWSKDIDVDSVANEILLMANDILMGRENSLCAI